MAVPGLTMDYANSIINVAKSYMQLTQTVPSTIYQLDFETFRRDLNDLADDVEGVSFLRTHRHNTVEEVSGAILAQVIIFFNGWTITFEDGQYRVESVGANTNISKVANVNQVSVSTANSAGLQDLNSLQAASFDSIVALDTTSSFSGTVFPIGTRQFPVNNLADAHKIADARGLHRILLVSTMTLATEDFSDGHEFFGDNPVSTIVVLDPSANVANCTFRTLAVTGLLDNLNILKECNIVNLQNVDGIIISCAINGTMLMMGGTTTIIIDSEQGTAVTPPVFDMNGSGQVMHMRRYSGAMKVINSTGGAIPSEIDMASGTVEFDATCTGGTFIVRGIAKVVNNSVGATIIDETVTNSGSTATQSSGLPRIDVVIKENKIKATLTKQKITANIGSGKISISIEQKKITAIIGPKTINAILRECN